MKTDNLTIKDKEQMIVGTILCCNNVMKSLNESFSRNSNIGKLFECDKFHFSFIQLASNITGESFKTMNEHANTFIIDTNFVPMNEHKNYYAYFKKVREFLNGFELEIQANLNESMSFYSPKPKPLGKGKSIDIKQTLGVGTNGITDNITDVDSISKKSNKSDIETFKDKLNAYIYELEQLNDTNVYSNDILKTKIFASRPIFVKGFDIVNSIVFQKDLSEKFNKNVSEMLAIWFDKSLKRLMFIFPNDVITYRIENDELIRPTQNLKFGEENYIEVLREKVTQNYLVMWQNVSNIKFTDNLYKDISNQNLREKLNTTRNFVK